MKITLDKITVTQVEVEMPDTCPHCGGDWRSEVIEDQLVAASEAEGLFLRSTADGLLVFDEIGSCEPCPEAAYYKTGYTCTHCHGTIVAVEVDETNPEQEKLQGV